MSLTRMTVIDVACDYCAESAEWIGVRTIAQAVEQAQSQGWVLYKQGRRWVAACRECAGNAGL